MSPLFLGVSFSPLSLVAVLAISFGILIMALKGKKSGVMRGNALFWALGTVAFTASCTMADGIGARMSGTPTGFIMWLFIGDAIGMLAHVILKARVHCFSGIAARLENWSCRRGHVARLLLDRGLGDHPGTHRLDRGLRESSILFSVLIATLLLRERVTGWRWMSAAAIAGGMALMKP